MAEVTPTPAPQDAATTQTPDQSAAPEQATPAAPAQASPIAQAQDMEKQAAAPSAAPAAPAPPSAQAAPKILPKRGLMASVLMGALKGADDAMKATGKAVVAAGKNSGIGQNIQNQKLARAKTQQQMDIDKQKAQQEATAALDKHTQDLLTIQKNNMDNIFQSHQNAQIESQWPTLNKEAQLTLQKNEREEMNAEIDFAAQMKLAGIHADTSHHQPGGPYDLLTQSHAERLGPNGKEIALANGKSGADSDLTFYSIPELQNSVLNADTKIAVDWEVDPKTKELKPIYQTLKAGENTWWDAIVARQAGMISHDRNQTMLTQQFENQQKAAQAEQERATAALNDAQVAQFKAMGVAAPVGYKPDPNNFTLDQSALQQKLTSQGVTTPYNFATLYGIAHYDIDPKSLTTTLRKGVGQMTRDGAMTYIRNFVNTSYDEGQYDALRNMEKEFADTRQGTSGGNLIAFNTATGHLGQLYDAAFALQNNNITALNKMANDLGVAVAGKSAPAIFDAIKGALVGELGRTFKGAAADIPERQDIEDNLSRNNAPNVLMDLSKTYAHLMLTKAGAQVAHYYAYKGRLPAQTIDPLAQQTFQHLGINTADILPQGASAPTGSVANPNPPSNATQALPISINGNVIGYSYDGGKTYVPTSK